MRSPTGIPATAKDWKVSGDLEAVEITATDWQIHCEVTYPPDLRTKNTVIVELIAFELRTRRSSQKKEGQVQTSGHEMPGTGLEGEMHPQ